MFRLINVHIFSGWTKKERREFWISLAFTVIASIAMIYACSIIFSCVQQEDRHDIINIA